MALSGSIQKMTERLFHAIGRSELIEDRRFRTNADRLEHVAELDDILGAFISKRTQEENVAFFEAADVTIGPILDASQIMADPHAIERELLADYPDRDMGQLPMHHVVPRFAGTPGAIRSPAPRLGEHNRALLAEIGIDGEALERLLKDHVVCGASEPPL